MSAYVCWLPINSRLFRSLRSMRDHGTRVLADNIRRRVAPVALHGQRLGVTALGHECDGRLASHNLKRALHLHQLLAHGILGYICRVQVHLLLDNVKEVLACHVPDGLATRDGHVTTLNLEDGLATDVGDVEAVLREGKDLLLEDQGLGAGSHVLLKDAHGALDGCELIHYGLN